MKIIKLLNLLNANDSKSDYVRLISKDRTPVVFMEGFFINESINQLKSVLKYSGLK